MNSGISIAQNSSITDTGRKDRFPKCRNSNPTADSSIFVCIPKALDGSENKIHLPGSFHKNPLRKFGSRQTRMDNAIEIALFPDLAEISSTALTEASRGSTVRRAVLTCRSPIFPVSSVVME